MSDTISPPDVPTMSARWKRPALILIVLAVSVAISMISGLAGKVPEAWVDWLGFAESVNAGEAWLKQKVLGFTRAVAGYVRDFLETIEDLLLDSSWVAVVFVFTWMGFAFGGMRLGILAFVCAVFWGIFNQWDAAMETLALMIVSVLFSIVFGILIGILSSQSDLLEKILRPILDVMQTMPAFVYLIPAVFFFGIGGPPSILATMIYAMPPAIRLTNHGIRQVPPQLSEVTESFGSSRVQALVKVKIPLALPSIMAGINQSIMMALGLVVLAAFIGANGLGYEVWQALRKLNVGLSLEAGLCIVTMAILLDRLSHGMQDSAERSGIRYASNPFHILPQSWDKYMLARGFEAIVNTIFMVGDKVGRTITTIFGELFGFILKPLGERAQQTTRIVVSEHPWLITGILLLILINLADGMIIDIHSFPDALMMSFREPVDQLVEYLTVQPTFIAFTKGIRAVLYLYFLNPLSSFLSGMPWWYSIALLTFVCWISLGWRFAVSCVLMLLFIALNGIWDDAMLTLASVLVSVLLCLIIGVPLGIWAGSSNTVETLLKPILDTMQTLPAFVYLVPVLLFFGGNVVSAVIATVVYALPPIVRMTSLGLRQIPTTTMEVTRIFGSTRLQTLSKVILPLSLPAIMIGVTQSVMMALAMQVITPLIGGTGLGQKVFHALSLADTGAGLAAGLGIAFLAIILDRLGHAWVAKQRNALGM
jgi:glycine betaine/proline transport system permease protein